MKNLFYFLMSAYAMAFAACSSDADAYGIEETTPLTIDVRLTGVSIQVTDDPQVHIHII